MKTAGRSQAVPSGRAVRGELRRLRRTRRPRSWRQLASDIYGALLYIAILGGIAVQGMLRVLRVGLAIPRGPAPLLVSWLTGAACLVCAGAGLRTLLSLGPIVAGPATRNWLLATPVRRRSLLLPRFLAAAAVAVATGMAAGAVVGAFIPESAGPATVAWSAVIGAAISSGLLAAAVALQPQQPREGRLIGSVLLGAGIALTITTLAVTPLRAMPALPALALPTVGLAVVIASAVLFVVALCALDQLTRTALAAGAPLAAAINVSATWLDLSILSGCWEEQRLRRIARVRSRPLAGTGWEVLLAADMRRTLRARGRLITALALGVVPYAGAALLPAAFVPALTAVLACVVAGLFTGGPRAVTRSTGLRRNLPINDRALVLVHLVIPLAAAVGWTLGVLPALLPLRPVAAALIPPGAVLVAYRVASRPSLDYSDPYMDPVFGMALPINLSRQLLRGPFLATVLAAVQLLLAG
jgi:hypothetical protein